MTRVHLSLPTAHLSAARAFYTALFGEGPDKSRPGMVRFAPAGVPVSLNLHEEGGPVTVPNNMSHMGLRTDSAGVSAAIGRLRSVGTPVLEASAELCCHAVQDKVWAADPDGRRWEVYTILDDVPGSATGCPTVSPSRPLCCP